MMNALAKTLLTALLAVGFVKGDAVYPACPETAQTPTGRVFAAWKSFTVDDTKPSPMFTVKKPSYPKCFDACAENGLCQAFKFWDATEDCHLFQIAPTYIKGQGTWATAGFKGTCTETQAAGINRKQDAGWSFNKPSEGCCHIYY